MRGPPRSGFAPFHGRPCQQGPGALPAGSARYHPSPANGVPPAPPRPWDSVFPACSETGPSIPRPAFLCHSKMTPYRQSCLCPCLWRDLHIPPSLKRLFSFWGKSCLSAPVLEGQGGACQHQPDLGRAPCQFQTHTHRQMTECWTSRCCCCTLAAHLSCQGPYYCLQVHHKG